MHSASICGQHAPQPHTTDHRCEAKLQPGVAVPSIQPISSWRPLHCPKGYTSYQAQTGHCGSFGKGLSFFYLSIPRSSFLADYAIVAPIQFLQKLSRDLEMKLPLLSFRSSLSPRNALSTRAPRLAKSGTINSLSIRTAFAENRQIIRSYSAVTVSAADLKFGQPVYETHPHILKAGERTLILFFFLCE